MSNFGFLRAEWPDLHDEAARAERNAVADPRAACFYARRCLELAVSWLFDADATLRLPYQSDLVAMIAEPSLLRLVGPAIRAKMDVIRRQGNHAVHRAGPVTEHVAVQTVAELFHVMYWVASRYARNPADLPAPGVGFDTSMIPRPVPEQVRRQRLEDLRRQAEEFARQREELAALRARNQDLDAQIAGLRAEIAVAKAANESRLDTHDYNEADTRTLLIDLLLKEAGWPLDRAEDREFPVTGLPSTAGGPGNGFVDYVLWDDTGLPLGLVEAKRTTKDPRAGQQQAKDYADALERVYGQRPLIFFTNGYETWLWDDLAYPPRPVQGFYTRDELRLLVQRRTTRVPLAQVPINDDIAGRHYQARAIRRIAEAFERDRQRQALLVMATGSGKTRTVIALVDLLARANWVKRVLFLADRTALVAQAAREFTRLLPAVPTVNLLTDRDADGRVMVSTYPTMMGLINEVDGELRRFGPGHFDLVVIDEAHRSIYQKYGAIFDYFDALLVGLTATPKDEIDRNTYRMFHLEDGVPTDSYPLDEAVREHYLVPPRVVDVPLKFQRDGIRYADLSEAEKERWDATEWDEDGTIPAEISSEELNRFLFNADTVDKALGVLMRRGLTVAGGDRIGKTIVFAKNQDHAYFIAQRFDVNYPEHRGEFARVITHQTERAQLLIDAFATPGKNPHIAISVDMLDTGIDVPEVVNLVFFKLVRSRTKFWQMLGRGTRLCPDLFGPNQDKEEFYVFDLCQNVEFFNQDLMPAESATTPGLGQRIFQRRVDLIATLDRAYPHQGPPAGGEPDGTGSEVGLRWDLAHRLHDEVAGMNPDNVLVRPHRAQVDFYVDLANWHTLTPDRHREVVEHLAALPTAFRDDDPSEEARRFDLLVLRLQLAAVGAEAGFDRLRAQVQEIAAALLGQTTIPAVRAQQQLLDEIAGDDWWPGVTLPMLETVRRRVRSLVKLIDRTRRAVVYSDFEDSLGELTESTLRGVAGGVDRSRFEAKVRTYLRSHEDQLAIQKLRRNRQITTTDLETLTQIFIESGFGTRDDIGLAAREHQGLGLFLRSLTGLDREAARRALDEFHAGKTFNGDQLHFLGLLVDTLARNGVIDPGRLYDPPFTHIAVGGPEDLFAEHEVNAIVTILDGIRSTAIPASSVA